MPAETIGIDHDGGSDPCINQRAAKGYEGATATTGGYNGSCVPLFKEIDGFHHIDILRVFIKHLLWHAQ
ncbi:hypothetical protein D3C80_1846330 [compost metagenome]